jgi:pimeloyl-ACP methyl ester carboxylesterase
MCEDYRASASVDLDESRKDLDEGKKIKCPVRVLWGKQGVIEKCFDATKEWRAVAEEGVDVSGKSVDCGHYLPEQAPNEVLKEIRNYFH